MNQDRKKLHNKFDFFYSRVSDINLNNVYFPKFVLTAVEPHSLMTPNKCSSALPKVNENTTKTVHILAFFKRICANQKPFKHLLCWLLIADGLIVS